MQLPSNSYWPETEADSPFPPPEKIENASLGELFFAQAKEQPLKCFAAWRDLSDGQWTLATYQEAASRAARLVQFFSQESQIPAQARVCLLSGNTLASLLCDIALVSAGWTAVWLPQSPDNEQLHAAANELQVKCFIVDCDEQLHRLKSFAEQSGSGSWTAITLAGLPADTGQFPFPVHALPELTGIAEEAPVPGGYSDVICIQQIKDRNEAKKLRFVAQTNANHLAAINSILLSAILKNGDGVFIGRRFDCSFARLGFYSAIAAGGSVILPTPVLQDAVKWLKKDLAQSHPKVLIIDSTTLNDLLADFTRTESRFKQWCTTTYRLLKGKQLSVWSRLKYRCARAGIRHMSSGIFGANLKHILVDEQIKTTPAAKEAAAAAEVEIFSGLWLPESTGAVSSNNEKHYKDGSLGRRFESIEVSIGEDGRLVLGGPACGQLLNGGAQNAGMETAMHVDIDAEGFLFLKAR